MRSRSFARGWSAGVCASETRPFALVLTVAGLGALSAACSGVIGESPGDLDAPLPSGAAPADTPGHEGQAPGGGPAGGAPGAAPPPKPLAACGTAGAPDPVASPLRRLTRFEYNNTIRDLLGDGSQPAKTFAPEEIANGLDNNADVLGVGPLLAEQFHDAAQALATRAAADPRKLLAPCDPTAQGEDACAADFMKRFGQRAFRRPLRPAEFARIDRIYKAGKAELGFSTALRMIVTYFLESPRFLYRDESASPAAAGARVAKVGPYEMASRLSYFLWATMPDDALMQAAAQNRLGTPQEIAAQVRRMLGSPKARPAVANFHAQWMEFADIERIEKNGKIFKEFNTGQLRPLLRTEAEKFVDHVVFEGGGTLKALLSEPLSFMNAELATFYGVSGPGGTAFEKVPLDPRQRGGILTQAGLLARLATPEASDPIRRGKYVREHLLCQPIPPPPPDVEAMAPAPSATQTTRERFATHSKNPFCAGCHRLIDPIGFAFEGYDGIGRWRTTENGKPIDIAGELVGTDVDGRFSGAVELGARLSGSRTMVDCLALQWFRFALGRTDRPEDQCTLKKLGDRLVAAGGSIPVLVETLTQSDQFLFRRIGD